MLKDEAYVVMVLRPPSGEEEAKEPSATPGWFLAGRAVVFATSILTAREFVEKEFFKDVEVPWVEIQPRGYYAQVADSRIVQIVPAPLYVPEMEGLVVPAGMVKQ